MKWAVTAASPSVILADAGQLGDVSDIVGDLCRVSLKRMDDRPMI